jgi:hypothetical protein
MNKLKRLEACGQSPRLVDRGHHALRVHLKHVGGGLTELTHAMDAALQ